MVTKIIERHLETFVLDGCLQNISLGRRLSIRLIIACCVDSLCFAVWKLVEEECLCLAVPRFLCSSTGVDINRA